MMTCGERHAGTTGVNSMANKDRKHKLNKQNKQRNRTKHELERDLHYINQHEEVMAEQMGIYDWSRW